MLPIRHLAVAALALALSAGSAQAAKGTKKKEHHLRGVVVAVENGKDGAGSFTIKTHKHKKGAKAASTAQSHTLKIHYGANTTFEIVKGKQHTTANASALRKGEHVTVAEKAHNADKVTIHQHAKTTKPGKKPATK